MRYLDAPDAMIPAAGLVPRVGREYEARGVMFTLEAEFCDHVRRMLGSVPVGGAFAKGEDLDEVLSVLCYVVPHVIREHCDDWKDSLDGIFLKHARRTGEAEAEFVGMCVLIADQTMAPLLVRVQLSDQYEVKAFDCKLGEYRGEGLERTPFHSSQWRKRLALLEPAAVDWVFEVSVERPAREASASR